MLTDHALTEPGRKYQVEDEYAVAEMNMFQHEELPHHYCCHQRMILSQCYRRNYVAHPPYLTAECCYVVAVLLSVVN